MSQQQAVQPIVLKQENGEVVLKLVLENPKQETQTLILQQPDGKEFAMSTDTTAIWSFVIAMVVAFILGISATVIAIWYGRKSFKLTEMSFDIVKDQIESSEKQIMDMNKDLIKSQQNLMLKTQKIEYIKRRNENFELASINFIHLAEQFSLFMLSQHIETAEISFNRTVPIESYEYQLHKKIQDRLKEIYDAFIKLRFNFRTILTQDDNEKELINILEEVVRKAESLQKELMTNKQGFKDYFKEYKQKIADAELMLNTILKEVSTLKINID